MQVSIEQVTEERDLYRKHFNEMVAEAKIKDAEIARLNSLLKVRKFDHEEKDMIKAVGLDPAEYEAAVQLFNELMEKLKEEERKVGTHFGSKYVQAMVENFDPITMLMLQKHVDDQKYQQLKAKVMLMQLLDL